MPRLDDKLQKRLERKRIFGIAAHIDAGKTTVSERMLYVSGVQYRPGLVDEGTATMDFEEEERERGITIYSAAIDLPFKEFEFTLIDTPGHVDFTAEVERCMRVLDGVVLVFDSSTGVEAQSETVFRQALRHEVPRIAFFNKLDKVGADWEASLQSIRDRLGVEPVSLQIPHGIGAEGEDLGLVDLVKRRFFRYRGRGADSRLEIEEWPADEAESFEAERLVLIEAVADRDDDLLEAFLEDQPIGADALIAALRRQTLAGTLLPVLGGAALRGAGVEPLMEAVAAYLPSPLDVHVPTAYEVGSRKERGLVLDPSAPLVAQIFKLVATRHGSLAWARIYQGTLEQGMQCRNTRTDKPERAQTLLRLQAGDSENLKSAGPGDVIAIKGFRNARTGDGVTAIGEHLDFPSWDFPLPVISMAIEARKVEDRDHLLESLELLKSEDPTVDWHVDEETDQILVSGMGELHLEVLGHKLQRDFKLECQLGMPRVAYRESVATSVLLDEWVKASLPGHEIEVYLQLQLDPDRSLDQPQALVELEIEEGDAKRYAHAIEIAQQVLANNLRSGPGHGYPMTQLRATLRRLEGHDGSVPAVDQIEIGLSLLMRGLGKRPEFTILEPWMTLVVTVPEEYLSPVLGEIQAQGGIVQNVDVRGLMGEVRASAPLSRLLDFSTRLRSQSQGRASSTMQLEAYRPVPEELRRQLLGLG